MINKFSITNLRNAEHFKFMVSAHAVFEKYGVERERLAPLYSELNTYAKAAEAAIAMENKITKIREKNEICIYRDRLNSKLFNYLKSIIYDDRDLRFDSAQRVMAVVKAIGNPSRMSENVESVAFTTLGNKLEPLAQEVEDIGAKQMVNDLMIANQQFIVIERECRELLATQKATKLPPVSELRKQVDPVYRALIDIINGYAAVSSKKDEWQKVIHEMNVLVERYDNLLAARKRTTVAAPAEN
jgi:hypothetical protein